MGFAGLDFGSQVDRQTNDAGHPWGLSVVLIPYYKALCLPATVLFTHPCLWPVGKPLAG